ncbi:TPA: site-specific integrase [Enterobacter asburiae]|nr:site-specific integrase [Enterobacter asburiae]QLO47210.1 site-specific integrase [Enterobacter cloacae]HDR2747840.1 site-specific integrase [Enterobacter asburiae]HDR2772211.1 site-specific integrase [Enterobacter asburiae]HDT5073691.1 site-specific integrase [Enterobacter asburiae]
MAFLKENKRKTVTTSNINTDTVINISLRDKFIKDQDRSANFERLLYENCPAIPITDNYINIKIDKPGFVYANRQSLVVRICNAIHSLDATDRTKVNVFNETVRFLKMADEHKIKDVFCIDTISMYIKNLVGSYNKGSKGKTLSGRQNSIKALLKAMDYELYTKCESIFFSFPADTQSVSHYTDDEVKDLFSALQTIYICYAEHVENGTKPKAFPLYELKDLDGNHKYKNKTSTERTVSYKNSDTVWLSDLVRVAYFMTCFYTGANASSLLKLRLSDFTEVLFKDLNRKTYKLSTKKGRQSGRTNEIDVGFTKEARVFFERWIGVSKKINNNEDGFFYPNPSVNNRSYMTDSSMSILNKTFVDLGLPALSSQRFRKTKASLIMRATESVFFVSQGLNNSVETVAKHYADGDPVTTEFSLASALYIREQTVLGKPLDKALTESAFLYHDPLKEGEASKEFKKLTNGLRCGGAFKDKAIKVKEVLVKNGLAESHDVVACHKFLECFGCKHHAIIAEVDDIWLLLSFNDVILESVTRPAINSRPSNLLNKVNNTIQVIIERMKREHAAVYNEAYDKYLNGMHPLWQDTNDLELMLSIY